MDERCIEPSTLADIEEAISNAGPTAQVVIYAPHIADRGVIQTLCLKHETACGVFITEISSESKEIQMNKFSAGLPVLIVTTTALDGCNIRPPTGRYRLGHAVTVRVLTARHISARLSVQLRYGFLKNYVTQANCVKTMLVLEKVERPFRMGDVVRYKGEKHIVHKVEFYGPSFHYATNKQAWIYHSELTLVRKCDGKSLKKLRADLQAERAAEEDDA